MAMAVIGVAAYLIARHGEPALRRAIGNAFDRNGNRVRAM
jgi:hypothetical protein